MLVILVVATAVGIAFNLSGASVDAQTGNAPQFTVVAPPSPYNANAGEFIGLLVTAVDPDPGQTDTLVYSLDGLIPTDMILLQPDAPGNPADIVWQTTLADAGTSYTFTVRVTDTDGNFDEEIYTINVGDAPPTATPTNAPSPTVTLITPTVTNTPTATNTATSTYTPSPLPPTNTSGGTAINYGIDWLGEYRNGSSFTGLVEATQFFPAGINITDTIAPVPNVIGIENWTLTATSVQAFAAGAHKFYVTYDENLRFFIDDVLVFELFRGLASPRMFTVERMMTPGDHSIRIEYQNAIFFPRLEFKWELFYPTPTPLPPTPTTTPGGTGISFGSYWNGTFQDGVSPWLVPGVEEFPQGVNFNWGLQPACNYCPADNWNLQAYGYGEFGNGVYRFYVASDDAVRVFIDNELVFERLAPRPFGFDTFERNMTYGGHSLVVYYYDASGEAAIQFSWERLLSTPAATPFPSPTQSIVPVVHVSIRNVTMYEGGTSIIYNVRLSAPPAPGERVVINVFRDGYFTNVAISPFQRTLDASNWSRGRNFTITSPDNSYPEPFEYALITHRVSSNIPGSVYNNRFAGSINVRVIDNDR